MQVGDRYHFLFGRCCRKSCVNDNLLTVGPEASELELKIEPKTSVWFLLLTRECDVETRDALAPRLRERGASFRLGRSRDLRCWI